MAKSDYKLTRFACYGGYFSQATGTMFLPLLYVTFHTSFGIPLSKIAVCGVVNYLTQLFMDLLASKFVDKIGYRASAVTAHVCIALGLCLLSFLPKVLPPFAGITIAIMVYAVGGGLVEVIISPIMDSCPSPNKKGQMGLLHAMYSIGAIAVIGLSTLFFTLFGTDKWWIMSLLLTVIPLTTLILFVLCPFPKPEEQPEQTQTGKPKLFSSLSFYIFIVLILCGGASEAAIAQWVSAYAELGLGIDKTLGDVFGTMAFMAVFAVARLVYCRIADRYKTHNILLISGMITAASFLLASVVPNAIVNLIGCFLAGVGIGAMWPAVFSMAAARLPNGGTPLFSFLAFGGDVGCALGTYIIGGLADRLTLHKSVLCAVVFPAVFVLTLLLHIVHTKKSAPPDNGTNDENNEH